MISTGSYKNCEYGNSIQYKEFSPYGDLVSISGDGGALCSFKGPAFKKLAPKYLFWKEWHDNIGKIPELENNRFYISRYYNDVLKNLDASEVISSLKDSILLCYEPNDQFCHRHIVAYWLEIQAGIHVPEIRIEDSASITTLTRPEYIREELEKVMGINKHSKPKSVK